MTQPTPNSTSIDSTVLAQLLLMQSVLSGLPTEASIFAFVCRGLGFMPGVTRVRCDHAEPPRSDSAPPDLHFHLSVGSRSWGWLVVEAGDLAAVRPYVPFVRNFTAMVALILDERSHRAEIERHQEELEARVAERTRQLTAEIAERKSIEEQLQRSRDMLALTLDAVPQAIFWKDLIGRYLGCNRAFVAAVGLNTTRDVIGKFDADLPWRPEDIAGYRADDERAIATRGSTRAVQEKLRRADGLVRDIETTKAPLIDGGGRVYGVLGVFEDVTERNQARREREQLQAQLIQAQKMESVGRLAGGVAHDFNNMLQAILGNASLALLETHDLPKVAEHLQEIFKAAERSAALTQQLLAFARKQTVAPKVLDLNHVVSSMTKMLQRLIGEHIRLTWQPADPLWTVRIDPIQVDQVLVNLVVNARDAIVDAGEIRIGTGMQTLRDPAAQIGVSGLAPGDYVTLSVADNGAGMSPESQVHLFEPFYTTKPAGQGTGLGLATVYGIAQQNQGAVTVRTSAGNGTTFTLYLPRAEGPVAAPAPRPKTERQQRTETLLVVEDEEQILTLTQRVLQLQGYTVLTAASPDEAIRLAHDYAGPIHLLVSDVMLPGMKGRDLFCEIARLKPGLRCIFMSGYNADVLGSDHAFDPSTFQAKPFTPAELTDRVRLTLEAPPPELS